MISYLVFDPESDSVTGLRGQISSFLRQLLFYSESLLYFNIYVSYVSEYLSIKSSHNTLKFGSTHAHKCLIGTCIQDDQEQKYQFLS